MYLGVFSLVLVKIGCAVYSLPLNSTDGVFDFIAAGRFTREISAEKYITTDVLIKKSGFQPEVHRVVTDDGFILRLTRIKVLNPGPPVLMVHGLFEASDTWLQRGRKKDLALMLAENGYDVWLADVRGNAFSRKHKSLKVNEPQFWDFSFHEIGVYDLPAFITEILKYSTHQKICYIGHSMGTTSFFVMASLKPEFNNYIQTSVHLSPVVFSVNSFKSNIIKQLLIRSDSIKDIFNRARIFDILPRNNFTGMLSRISCTTLLPELCLNFIGDVFGENRKNLNKAKLGDYISSSLSGGSVKTILHYSQIYKTDEFKQFDYGEDLQLIKNLQIYGQPTPPHYPLNLISSPVVLFYGDSDHLLDERAVTKLASLLPNVIYKESLPNYSHIDYMFGDDAPKLLYSKIVNIFREIVSS